jgi:hypothetical protein
MNYGYDFYMWVVPVNPNSLFYKELFVLPYLYYLLFILYYLYMFFYNLYYHYYLFLYITRKYGYYS